VDLWKKHDDPLLAVEAARKADGFFGCQTSRAAGIFRAYIRLKTYLMSAGGQRVIQND